MTKLFTFVALLLTTSLLPFNAAGTENKNNILNKINSLPMCFSGKTVSKSGYTVQRQYCWQFKEKNNIYHAAILFEDYPEGIHSDSQRFLSLFMVWKNGKIYYRRVIENDPEHIKITAWELSKSSDKIYLSLDYDFQPYFTDVFTSQKSKCNIVLPVTGHLHASIADFDKLPIGNLTIKNGVAKSPGPPEKEEPADGNWDYRHKYPLYQIVFPHCYVVKNGNHTFHIALIDRQHEDLLTIYIWKDGKQHSMYLLDNYDQFDSTPDRMKINSGPGATRSGKTPDGKYISIPVWEGIFLRYVVNNYFGRPDSEFAPSTSYYKHNYLTVKLKNPGTYDMRKQRFNWGVEYSPRLKE